ncbi:MAG: glutamate dehydrogenase, partial [Myxococcota bacterium]
MRFGRLDRRFEEQKGMVLVEALEQMTGQRMPPELGRQLMRGANELDLVRSGLDDTMRNAFQEMLGVREAWDGEMDLRTAAFVCALQKIVRAHLELGV